MIQGREVPLTETCFPFLILSLLLLFPPTASSFTYTSFSPLCSHFSLKMEAAGSSKTLVLIKPNGITAQKTIISTTYLDDKPQSNQETIKYPGKIPREKWFKMLVNSWLR
jgi:hypothetical protein